MNNKLTQFAFINFYLTLPLAACAQFIGIEDLPPITRGMDGGTDTNTDGGMDGGTNTNMDGGSPRFVGFASWAQDVVTQTDAEQDALMDAACSSAFGEGSRAAKVAQMTFRQIADMPLSNTSTLFLLGKCPDCEGTINTEARDGHLRVCLPPDDPFPTTIPWSAVADCSTLTRSAMCITNQIFIDKIERQ